AGKMYSFISRQWRRLASLVSMKGRRSNTRKFRTEERHQRKISRSSAELDILARSAALSLQTQVRRRGTANHAVAVLGEVAAPMRIVVRSRRANVRLCP